MLKEKLRLKMWSLAMRNKELPNKLIPFLWYFIKKYKITFSLYAIFAIFIMDLPMFFLQPYLLKVLFDKINSGIITINGGLWLIAGIAASDTYLPSEVLINLLHFHSITKTIEDIRDKMFSYSIKQSASFFNTNYSGELVSKINAITNSLGDVACVAFDILKNFFLLLVLAFVLFFFNKMLGFSMLVWFCLYLWITYNYLIKKSAIQSKLVQENQNKITAFVTDNFMNIQNIKAFSSEKREKENLIKLLTKKFKKIYLEIKYQQISEALYFTINFSMACFMVLVAIFQLKTGIIEIGSFVFLIDIVRKFLLFARQISWSLKSIKDFAVMQDSLELITNDIEIKDKKDAEKLKVNKGRIIFRNINFTYKKEKI